MATSTTQTNSEKKSVLPLMLGIALLATVGGGAAAWFMTQRSHAAESRNELSNVPKYIVHMEGFTVNLADAEQTHFLRVTMDLGIDRLPERSEGEKATSTIPVARIRDSILSVLTVCKADALLTPEGKAQLKKNLLEALNRSVPELSVRDVYFTEFLVQR